MNYNRIGLSGQDRPVLFFCREVNREVNREV